MFPPESRKLQVQLLVRLIATRVLLPIFLCFWWVDCIYRPEDKWLYLAIRLSAIPLTLGVSYVMRRRLPSLLAAELVTALFVAGTSAQVTTMVFLSGGLNSLYYQGINLVALTFVPFLPLRPRFIALNILLIYGPFAVLGLRQALATEALPSYAVHCAIMSCTMFISLFLRAVAARLELRERVSEMRLARLARQVGHDVRSPLMALKITVAELAAIPEAERTIVTSALQRIEDMTSDLLGRHGTVRLESLSEIVADIVAEKRAELRGRPEIALEDELPARPCLAQVDGAAMRRALANVLNNAVEAIDGAGVVSIRLAVSGGRAVLSVADTGRGISPELLPHVGRDGATFGKLGGHGLGLSQVRAFAERAGAKLAIESAPGRGTTVRITLPMV